MDLVATQMYQQSHLRPLYQGRSSTVISLLLCIIMQISRHACAASCYISHLTSSMHDLFLYGQWGEVNLTIFV